MGLLKKLGVSLAGAKTDSVETERAGHSAWSAARRWQTIRGAVGEEQPGASRKASRLTCEHSVPHLPLPDEGLLEVGRQCEKSKCSLFLVTPPHWPLPATLAWAAHLMGRNLHTTTAWRAAPWQGHGEEETLWHSSPAVQSLRQLFVCRQLQFAVAGLAS